MKAVLEARGIRRWMSGRKVLDTGDLTFMPASLTALCGPNGAGKSTLLQILALLDFPDEGKIVFDGEILNTKGDWYAARKKITLVHQNPYPFHGSVFHNVYYGLRLRGVSEDDAGPKVEEVLYKVGLSGFERRRANTLSGGELQRMSIARAIVTGPRVLLLDEPTAHVDSSRVTEVEEVIRSLRDDGMTVVLATHGHDQACRLADRVLSISEGVITDDAGAILPGEAKPGDPPVLIAKGTAEEREAVVGALELAGDHIIVRIDGAALAVRVPSDQVRQAGLMPGTKIKVRPDV